MTPGSASRARPAPGVCGRSPRRSAASSTLLSSRPGRAPSSRSARQAATPPCGWPRPPAPWGGAEARWGSTPRRCGGARAAAGERGAPIDFVFLDAEKEDYTAFLELIVPLLPVGGLLVADNLTSHADDLAEFRRRAGGPPRPSGAGGPPR